MSMVIQLLLVTLLLICAIVVTVHKNVMMAIIVFGAYSTVMAIIWMFLESPDLAITEAAVGAGVSTVLFFLVFKRAHLLKGTRDDG